VLSEAILKAKVEYLNLIADAQKQGDKTGWVANPRLPKVARLL